MKALKHFLRNASLSLRAVKPGPQASACFRSQMTSELEFEKWSVISERGREASGVTYEEARRLVHRLAAEGRHALCIITDMAAGQIAMADSTSERDIATTV